MNEASAISDVIPVEVPPMDAHNRKLVDNVHPAEWPNPEPAPSYNLVVIGGGTAGLVAAAGSAGLGARVALIERHLLGGDCLNSGCVPSKSLLRSAHAIADIRAAADVGVAVDPSGVKVDFGSVMERLREIRSRISKHDSATRFRDELGVDVFIGDGRFKSAGEIEVAGKTLKFKKAVIATGARPFVPQIPGLEGAGYHTNESIFGLTELPARIGIIGGGPIGCELAQSFACLGSKVTLIEQSHQFLVREDPDAADTLRAALERDGVDVALDTAVAAVEGSGEEKRMKLVRGGSAGGEQSAGEQTREEWIEVDAILVGAGRIPNVEDLGLEAAGIETDRAGVVVDDQLRTTNPNVYASGDVCMSTKFTHAADFASRAVIQNALFFGRKKVSSLTIPWCTYTRPEIAHVGMYERDAREKGIEVDTWVRSFAEVDRAIAEGEEEGFVKIHTVKGKDTIVGATIVAKHAGEMISEVSVAMAGGLGLSKLSAVIHPYPTQAEAIRQVGDAFNRTKLTPLVTRLFDLILRWRR
ncbi:MAG: mercuric reductase [Myxococcota bacterium]|jgi:pyruvate/2-oxoglutarate dehydrogenase complex dihydrolipoamide dehydrogenase (E3) component|nr:mercuric reductase [Myxococcota bacterium]